MGVLSDIQPSPVYTDSFVSTGKPYKFRPYNAGEEQALLTAKESGSTDEILETTKMILSGCLFNAVDINSLASFDIEHMLLMLRSKSVGEDIELPLECKQEDCKKVNNIVVNIEKDIKKPKIPKDLNIVKLNDNLILTMKYPGFDILEKLNEGEVSMFKLLAGLIETVVSGEKVIEIVDLDPEEVVDFVKKLNSKTIKKIVDEFILKIPKIQHTVKFKCEKCKKDSEYRFEGFRNFFI